LACGGGGALCGAFMGELLNTKNVIIPEFAASFCAWSMFCLDIGRDYLRTYISKLDEADPKVINALYHDMVDEALSEFKVLNVSRKDLTIVKSADVRYAGQFHEIELTLPAGEITQKDLESLKQEFHKKHDELFTFSLPKVQIELRNLRLIASVKSAPIDLPKIERKVHPTGDLVKRRRPCFFKGKFMDTPIYDGNRVGPGTSIQGHAIVEVPTTTIVIPPGFTCNVDEYGNYILNRGVS
jgi:N-methylhydantoinase A